MWRLEVARVVGTFCWRCGSFYALVVVVMVFVVIVVIVVVVFCCCNGNLSCVCDGSGCLWW